MFRIGITFILVLLSQTITISAMTVTPACALYGGFDGCATRSDSDIVGYLSDKWNVKFSNNNSIVIFKNGQEKFDDLFSALREARQSIHLEYFNFRNDSISSCLFEILKERVRAGVKVRALFDGFGNSSNNKPLKRSYLDSLRKSGIEIYEFDPMRFPYINHAIHRDHRKIVVIDGMIAYTGGMNVADYYIKGKPEFGDWRDIHARVEGDAVGSLQSVFINFWNKVTGQDLSGAKYFPGEKDASKYFLDLPKDEDSTAGKKRIGVVNRDPYVSPKIIHDTFVRAIDGAQKQIQIINPYFTLCPHIKKALKKAIKRGVDVQVMVSAKSDIPITPRIVEYNVHHLMRNGAKVYFYLGGFHHSKIMMVDSLYSFIGSANLNSRSLSFDYECNLLIADVPTTKHLQDIFEIDKHQRCIMLTPAIWRKVSKWKKFKGWFFHFLTPFVENERGNRLNPTKGEYTEYLEIKKNGNKKEEICLNVEDWFKSGSPSPGLSYICSGIIRNIPGIIPTNSLISSSSHE